MDEKLKRLFGVLDHDNAETFDALKEIRDAERQMLKLRALAQMAEELEAEGISAASIRRKMSELASEAALPAPETKALPSSPPSNGGTQLPLLSAPPRKRGRPPKSLGSANGSSDSNGGSPFSGHSS